MQSSEINHFSTVFPMQIAFWSTVNIWKMWQTITIIRRRSFRRQNTEMSIKWKIEVIIRNDTTQIFKRFHLTWHFIWWTYNIIIYVHDFFYSNTHTHTTRIHKLNWNFLFFVSICQKSIFNSCIYGFILIIFFCSRLWNWDVCVCVHAHGIVVITKWQTGITWNNLRHSCMKCWFHCYGLILCRA